MIEWLKGFLAARVTLRRHQRKRLPITDITKFQRRIQFAKSREYSQNGEDGILEAIFAMIGTTNRYFVDFGARDGKANSNTLYLRRHEGWNGLLMDGEAFPEATGIKQEFVTAENIEMLFEKYGVPEQFDLLSIDIDGNDYWVWKAIGRFRPRVVVIEYNACIPAEPAVTIPYEPEFVWDKTDYFGASLSALVKLGTEKGYTLVGTDRTGVNAFFVLDELVPGRFELPSSTELYHPAAFFGKAGNKHPPDPRDRPWVPV